MNRRQLLTALGAGLAVPTAGCSQRTPQDSQSNLLTMRPFPRELVGDDAFVDQLTDSIESQRFPAPDPALPPVLTKARFVADAASAAGEDAFAARITEQREPLFEPLLRFDTVVRIVSLSEEDRLDEVDLEELTSRVDLTPDELPLEEDPETIVEAALTERERTFFDYPGPPGHMVEAAQNRGRDQAEQTPTERASDVPEPHREYVRQRATVEQVAAGARPIAVDAYGDLRSADALSRTYESSDEYASVVAFNIGLASESMLEDDGELITPP